MGKILEVNLEGALTPLIKEYGFDVSDFPGEYYNAFDFAVNDYPETHTLPTEDYPKSLTSAGTGVQLGDSFSGGTICEKPAFTPSSEDAIYYPMGVGGREISQAAITRGFRARSYQGIDTGGYRSTRFYLKDKDLFISWMVARFTEEELKQGVRVYFTYDGNWHYSDEVITDLTGTLGIEIVGTLIEGNSAFYLPVTITKIPGEDRYVLPMPIPSEEDFINIAPVRSPLIPSSADAIPSTEDYFPDGSVYDKKCLCDYRGVSSTGTIINNLLKFPEVSSEEVTETTVITEIYSYKISTIETVYSVEVRKNGVLLEENIDYTLSSTGLIKSIYDFEAGSNINILIKRHNFWISSWNALTNKCIATNLPNNFLDTLDAIDIKYKGTQSAIFCREVEIPEDGWYNLSGFFRVDSENEKNIADEEKVNRTAYVRGLHLSSNVNTLTDDSLEHICYADSGVEIQEITTPSPCRLFEIGTSWKRISQAYKLTAGTYYVVISWDYSVLNKEDSLRVAGLCLNKGIEAPTYDSRNISYNLISASNERKHPVLIEFPEISLNSDWALGFTRYIFDSPLTGKKNLDCLGNLKFGYDENGPVAILGNTSIDLSSQISPDFDVDSYYRNYEKIYMEYHKEDNYLEMFVLNPGGNYILDIPLDNTFEVTQVLDSVKWNLMLGCYLESNEMKFDNSHYKNIWWFPTPLSRISTDRPSELDSYLYDRIRITKDTVVTSRGDAEKATLLWSDSFREGSPQRN